MKNQYSGAGRKRSIAIALKSYAIGGVARRPWLVSVEWSVVSVVLSTDNFLTKPVL
jgi:hypothetical protein